MKKLILILITYLPTILGQVNIFLSDKAIKNNAEISISKNENLKIKLKSKGYLQAYIQENLFPLTKRNDYSISSETPDLSIPLNNFQEDSILIFVKKNVPIKRVKKIAKKLSSDLSLKVWDSKFLHPINQNQKIILKIAVLNSNLEITHKARINIVQIPIGISIFHKGKLLRQGNMEPGKKITIKITNYTQKTQYLYMQKFVDLISKKVLRKKFTTRESIVINQRLKKDMYYILFHREKNKDMQEIIKKLNKIPAKKISSIIPSDKVLLVLRSWDLIKNPSKKERLFENVIGWKISAHPL